jgi:hypothetical protein
VKLRLRYWPYHGEPRWFVQCEGKDIYTSMTSVYKTSGEAIQAAAVLQHYKSTQWANH